MSIINVLRACRLGLVVAMALALVPGLSAHATAEESTALDRVLSQLATGAEGAAAESDEESPYCTFLRTSADDLLLFPEWPAEFFDEPPARPGPLAVRERLITLPRGSDGCPLDITIFEPLAAPGPRPALIWVQGSNVQPYFQQSLHEILASWGYIVIVPDTRPLTFIPDAFYHARNVGNAWLATELAARGILAGLNVDPYRIAAGGYSIGGTMATFLAAKTDRIQTLVMWAPTSAPFWSGVDPVELWPQVSASALLLLGELDTLAPPDEFPADLQAAMTASPSWNIVIPGGTHLFFQQPSGADSLIDPDTDLTRFEQQGIAIRTTKLFLDWQLGGPVPQ